MFGKKQRNGDPIAKLEGELSALRERRTTIEVKVAEATRAVAAAHDARRAAFLDADLGDAEAAGRRDAACRDAESALVGLEGAVDVIDRKIGETEAALATERDKVARSIELALRRPQLLELEAAAAEHAAVVARLVQAMRDVAPCAPLTAAGHANQTEALAAAIGASAAVVRGDLRSYCDRIEAGTETVAPTPTPRPAAPPPAPPIARKAVLLTVDGVWSEADGEHTCGRYHTAALPVAVAEKALALGHAVEVGSEVGQRLRASMTPGYLTPPRDQCIALTEPAPPGRRFHDITRPILHAATDLIRERERVTNARA